MYAFYQRLLTIDEVSLCCDLRFNCFVNIMLNFDHICLMINPEKVFIILT